MADAWEIGCTTLMKHEIVTEEMPILIKLRRQPMNLEIKIDEAITNLWDNNIIRKCNSKWNTLLVCVSKKRYQIMFRFQAAQQNNDKTSISYAKR